MDIYTASEESWKNGFEAGYLQGVQDSYSDKRGIEPISFHKGTPENYYWDNMIIVFSPDYRPDWIIIISGCMVYIDGTFLLRTTEYNGLQDTVKITPRTVIAWGKLTQRQVEALASTALIFSIPEAKDGKT